MLFSSIFILSYNIRLIDLAMKFFSITSLFYAAAALASPLALEKRCSTCTTSSGSSSTLLTESAFGYASLNGGTVGGYGGETVTVSTLADLETYAKSTEKLIIVITESISDDVIITVAGSKTIIASSTDVVLTGVGFLINSVSDVIIRNLTIKKVLAATGSAIEISTSTNVWIDHCDLSSDQLHGEDYYGGLIDILHASDYITLSYNSIHDHYNACTIGHVDDIASEVSGHLAVTLAFNYFNNLASHAPLIRFGKAHCFNNYFNVVPKCINVLESAQVLVEANVFVDVETALESDDLTGGAVISGNNFGAAVNTCVTGTLTVVSYAYELLDVTAVVATLLKSIGVTLSISVSLSLLGISL